MSRQRDQFGRFVKGNTEGHRFKAGEVSNPNGRPPLLCNLIKNLPAEAREQVANAFWTAISQPDVKSVQRFLLLSAEELPECGFILQLAAKQLVGNKGWFALMDICDRLFGKPRQIAEIEGNFNVAPPPIIIEGEDDE